MKVGPLGPYALGGAAAGALVAAAVAAFLSLTAVIDRDSLPDVGPGGVPRLPGVIEIRDGVERPPGSSPSAESPSGSPTVPSVSVPVLTVASLPSPTSLPLVTSIQEPPGPSGPATDGPGGGAIRPPLVGGGSDGPGPGGPGPGGPGPGGPGPGGPGPGGPGPGGPGPGGPGPDNPGRPAPTPGDEEPPVAGPDDGGNPPPGHGGTPPGHGGSSPGQARIDGAPPGHSYAPGYSRSGPPPHANGAESESAASGPDWVPPGHGGNPPGDARHRR
jgi:hypothetical protein